jgi:molybdenum cofactor synthesis domain-containing protein
MGRDGTIGIQTCVVQADVMAFEEAQRRIVDACPPLGPERIPLRHAAGRVAARPIVAEADLVPFARSGMDGFAVRADDLAAAPLDLPVRGRLFAGWADAEHAPRTATAIATGAAMPRGADSVLPIEDVETSDGIVRVARAVAAGIHVFPAGEDARAGESLVAAGVQLRPSTLGLLAAAGHAYVDVYRKPKVALICTGDELVPIEVQPGYGQIRNSNAEVIAASLEAFGASVVGIEAVGDDRVALTRILEEAFGAANLVLTTGGASVGERDLVKPILDELGVTFTFRSVALRPAKPSAFGTRGDVRIGVLPGNPSSAFVALQELIRPAIRALAGQRCPLLPRVIARLEGNARAKPGLTYASYAQVRVAEDGFVVRPLTNQCSSLTRTASLADGFVIIPPGSTNFATGARMAADVFDWTGVAKE